MNENLIYQPRRLWAALIEYRKNFKWDEEVYDYIADTYGVVRVIINVTSDAGERTAPTVVYRVIDHKKYNLFLLKYGHIHNEYN